MFCEENSGARLKSTLPHVFFENEMQIPTTITGATQVDAKESEKSHLAMNSDETTCHRRKRSGENFDLSSESNFECTAALIKEEHGHTKVKEITDGVDSNVEDVCDDHNGSFQKNVSNCNNDDQHPDVGICDRKMCDSDTNQ